MKTLRMCGKRVAGGIYLEVPMSKNGKPVEYFIIDPPLPLGEMANVISPVGVTLLEGPDNWIHAVDWVGEKFYPNVTDVIEEGRRMGFSRRVPSIIDFSLLQPGSRLLLVHRKAIVEDPSPYYMMDKPTKEGWDCPKNRQEHYPNLAILPDLEELAMCAGIWWLDLVPDTVVDGVRTLPCGPYEGLASPVVGQKYQPGVFMSLPIGYLTVILDPQDGTHVAAMQKTEASRLPTMLMEE